MQEIVEAVDGVLKTHPKALIKVVGVPGAGKTQRVADYLTDRNRNKRVDWGEMLSVSFSRSAARAFRTRLEKQGAPKEAVNEYRTIHSRCYRLLGLRRTDVMSPAKLAGFLDDLGFRHSINAEEDDEDLSEETDFLRFVQQGQREGDKLVLADHLLRNSMGRVPKGQLLALFKDDGSMTIDSILRFSKRYSEFREKGGFLDFTQILEESDKRGLYPQGLRVLVVDEAQDLSPIQIQVLRGWTKKAETQEIVFLGDDDQSIYTWAGADVEWFIDGIRAHRTISLGLSHRLPTRIMAEAAKVIVRNKRRIPKEMESSREGGSVEIIPDPEAALDHAIRTSGKDKAIYVLARSKDLLAYKFQAKLEGNLIPYKFMGNRKSVWQTGLKTAVSLLFHLRRTRNAFPFDLNVILKYVPQKGFMERGIKKRIKDMAVQEEQSPITLDELKTESWGGLGIILESAAPEEILTRKVKSDLLKRFLAKVRKDGYQSLNEEPKIWLGTKHASKGLEAETVVVLESENIMGNDEETAAERRVVYVARTRPSQRLIIVPTERNF